MEGNVSKEYDVNTNLEIIRNIPSTYNKICFLNEILPNVIEDDYIKVLLELQEVYKLESKEFLNELDKKKILFFQYNEIEKIVSLSEEACTSFIIRYLNKIADKSILVDVSLEKTISFLLNKIENPENLINFLKKVSSSSLSKKLRGPLLIKYAKNIAKYNTFQKEFIKNYFSEILTFLNINKTLKHFESFALFYEKTNNMFPMDEVIKFFETYYGVAMCALGKKSLVYKLQNKNIYEATDRYFAIMYKCFPENKLPKDLKQIFENATNILNSSSKVNTLTMNPNINLAFIKYIYPNLGHEKSMLLLKYNTSATKNLISHYKNEDAKLVDFYLKLIAKYNIFSMNSEGLHIIFRALPSMVPLLKELRTIQWELTEQEIDALKRIIITNNHYNIDSVSKLKKYQDVVKKEFLKSSQEDITKDYVAKVFGLNRFFALIRTHNSYQLSNFTLLKEIYIDAQRILTKKEFDKIKLTSKEIRIILLIKKIIITNSTNCEKSKFNEVFMGENICDMSLELATIINKIRKLYSLHLNKNFTQLNDLEKYKTDTINGIPVYKLENTKFKFLLHVIACCDGKFTGYNDLLLDNPTLWNKLEGATTLSTSSISESNFNCVGGLENEAIKLLFNNIPTSNLLYMNYQDSFVEHGGHKFEPKAEVFHFSNLSCLNQKTQSYKYLYSEITMYRQNVLPCAVACFGNKPDKKSIAFAQKFNLPIICIDVDKYLTYFQKNTERLYSKFVELANKEVLQELLYSNEFNNDFLDIIEILFEQYNSNKIDYKICQECLIETIQTMMKKEIHESFVYNIMRIRMILDILHHKFPDKKITYILIKNDKKNLDNIAYQAIEVSIEGKTYIITYAHNKTEIALRKLAYNLRKKINPNNVMDFQVLNSNHNLIIQTYISSINNQNILKENYFDVAKDIALDYFLGTNIQCKLSYIKENNQLKKILGISTGYIEVPNTLDNFDKIKEQNILYAQILNSCHISTETAANVKLAFNIIANKIENLTPEDFDEFVKNIEEPLKLYCLSLLLERQKFVPSKLRELANNYESDVVIRGRKNNKNQRV